LHAAVFGLYRLRNLGHCLTGRQQGDQVFEQHLARAVHKSAPVVAKRVDSEKEGTIQHRSRRRFGIRIEIVFDTVAEQEFVAKYFLGAFENRLAGTKRCPGKASEDEGVFCVGECGFHHYDIGVSQRNFRRIERGATPQTALSFDGLGGEVAKRSHPGRDQFA
jgi:hypothetical protein